jgi:multiple antibiotic resistance protein
MNFYKIMCLMFLSLIPIINPIGMASIFLSLTSHFSPEERHKIAYKVALFSALILIGVLFIGPFILYFFGLSLPFIRVAGGLLVSITAWQMMNTKSKLSKEEKRENEDSDEIIIFPLTLPITAGAGAIAITLSIALNLPNEFTVNAISQYAGAISGILLMALLIAVCYRFSDYILDKIGKTGSSVVTRLSAFVLLAIGISVVWDGLLALIIIAKAAK